MISNSKSTNLKRRKKEMKIISARRCVIVGRMYQSFIGGRCGEEKCQCRDFQGAISQCFLPFFYVYVERQDLELQSRVRSYVDAIRVRGFPTLSAVKTSSAAVLPSAVDLFVFFRRAMAQCAQVHKSTAQRDLKKNPIN